MVNTMAQYTKAVINTLLSLYTVRLVLKTIGESDYGIMSIIMGIVAFLGFITNALVVTTQRHLSYDYGSKSSEEVRATFSNCFTLHVIIGLILLVLLLALEPLIVSPAVLNIASGRWEATHYIYKVVAVMLFTTFVTAPFKALLIARENIVFVSTIEILDGLLKVGMVVCLPYVSGDKLEAYSLMILAIYLFEWVVYTVFDIVRYDECAPGHFIADTSWQRLKQLCGFAGWTTYGMGVIVGRNQGVAWLINYFLGTVVNAAYGVATQILTAVTFISTSVCNAMNPQIMRAEGNGNRPHMLHMAEAECKVIVCTASLVFVPIMVEMPDILAWWLVKVPPYTTFLADMLLLAFLIDQFTTGLNAANQAIGNIKVYSLLMYTPKLFVVPIGFVLLRNGYGVGAVMAVYVGIELLVAVMRLPYLRHTAGLSMVHYTRHVLLPCIALIAFTLTVACLLRGVSDSVYRFFFTIPACCLLGAIFAWFACLGNSEKENLKNAVHKKHVYPQSFQ